MLFFRVFCVSEAAGEFGGPFVEEGAAVGEVAAGVQGGGDGPGCGFEVVFVVKAAADFCDGLLGGLALDLGHDLVESALGAASGVGSELLEVWEDGWALGEELLFDELCRFNVFVAEEAEDGVALQKHIVEAMERVLWVQALRIAGAEKRFGDVEHAGVWWGEFDGDASVVEDDVYFEGGVAAQGEGVGEDEAE